MEFGALIPLYYMSMCCLITTPVIGLLVLISIRYKQKDLPLSRNIFFTVLSVCFLWFVYPMFELIYAAIVICKVCPDSSFKITGELVLESLATGAGMALMPGTAIGFLIAFLIVTPATLIVRRFRHQEGTDIQPGE